MTQTQTVSTARKPTKRSAFIAKCAAPFATKQHSQIAQEIHLDDPFRQYSPGDTVKGSVHLSIAKPLRITHLTIRLHGFVKVINRAKLPGEEIQYDEKLFATNAGRRGRRGIEYFGNGFAQLFDDEHILCGEGCVSGQYVFGFEMLLPSRGLPSSINFEHGTISYLLSSTITRPTTIAPTSTIHKGLSVQEIIDIAPIPKPKSQTLSLEELSKKYKSRSGARKKTSVLRNNVSLDSANSMDSPTPMSPAAEDNPPRSPVPSELSSASATGSSACSNQTGSRTPPLSTFNESIQGSNGALDQHTAASATTELLQGGCLAGEALPIRILISHAKPLKNMQGIVITLFRQGRIDTHPAIPLGPSRRSKNVEYEDYYPRSRTGLGGLSLSSAGSSRSFRQDLNQIFAPIIVDPHTHEYVINTSISVPVDLFPTISCVPGSMISFNYFVEVVIDLRSRIGNQDKIRPHLSMTSTQQHGYGEFRISRHESADGVNFLSTPGFNYLITDQLRRTRGVIFTRDEITIGTRDSTRKRGKQKEVNCLFDSYGVARDSVQLGREQELDDLDFDRHNPSSETDSQGSRSKSTHGQNHQQTVPVPPPEIDEELDEKAQLRRAERRLLPSAPPEDDEVTSDIHGATAPEATDEEDFVRRYGLGPPAPAYEQLSNRLPTYVTKTLPHDGASHLLAGPHDDKQELEQQRLLALASAPDYEVTDEFASLAAHSPRPTAPFIVENKIFIINDPQLANVSDTNGGLSAEQQGGNIVPAAAGEICGLEPANEVHQGQACPSSNSFPPAESLPVYQR